MMKSTLYIQFDGKQVESEALLAQVKAIWKKEGRKLKDLEKVELYVKPEEQTAYYLLNGQEEGSIRL